MWLPLCSLASVLMYQGTNPALYYLVGTGVYFWGFCEGEVSAVVGEGNFWGGVLTWVIGHLCDALDAA